METYDYAYCPNPNCFEKLSPDWECYKIRSKSENNIYKCPYCGLEFSCDDLVVTAVPVRNNNKRHVVIKDNKIVGEFSSNHIFKAGDNYYIHVPTKMLKDSRVFSVDKNLEDSVILDIAKNLKEESSCQSRKRE